MIVRIAAVTIATFFFGFIFNVRGRNLLFSAFGGGIAALIYEVGIAMGLNLYLTFFLATIGFAVYSEIMARVLKTTVTTFAISGLIPLVPGRGMYMTMLYMVNGDSQAALSCGMETLASAGIIALGIMMVSTFFKVFSDSMRQNRTSNQCSAGK